METSRILGWGKRQRRSDLESGKSIRVGRYEERLSETGTWQLRRKHRKDLRGRMLSLREGKIRDSPQPQFLSPCATQHPPDPPPSVPGFLTWLLLPFLRECLQAYLHYATRYCQPSPGEGQRAQSWSQIWPTAQEEPDKH